MGSLIERLRIGCPYRHIEDGSENIEPDVKVANEVMFEAADEIERLRAERDELFEANGAIANTIGADALRLRKALAFYARPIAYQGDNQHNNGQDPFTPADEPYIKSIGRDGGAIAREALAAIKEHDGD
jgi:hypothetical protein